MAKTQIFKLAKELGLSTTVMMEIAKEAGVPVKTNMASIDENQERQIREYFKKKEKGALIEERQAQKDGAPKTIIRRKKAEPAPEPEPTPEPAQPEEELVEAEPLKETEETIAAETETAKESAVEPEREAEEPQGEEEALAEAAVKADEPKAESKSEETAEAEETAQPEAAEPEVADAEAEAPKEDDSKDKKKPAKKVQKPKQVSTILGRIEIKPEPVRQRPQRPAPQRPASRPKPKDEVVDATPVVDQKAKEKKSDSYAEETVIGGHRKRKVVQDLYPEGLKRQAKKRKTVAEEGPLKSVVKSLKIAESIQIAELSRRMGLKAAEVIKKLFELGMMVTANQIIDFETASIVASEFDCQIERSGFEEDNFLREEESPEEDLVVRPPVVTVMGHVDHGKTTLLDYIRRTNVAAKEAGGITQHIGAYLVELKTEKVKGKIAFIDTPGHEAFTRMRARGAKITDIVILVVAADDGVMPQTVEAINHSREAKVPIIVAINKIDKPDSNIPRLKNELMVQGLVPEDLGGDTIMVEVSAKKGDNVEKLLEMVLLQAEIMNLRANPKKRAKGVVVEARLERGKGPVATVLIQDGTLRVGDHFVAGAICGRVRNMLDTQGGTPVKQAPPSSMVQLLGIDEVPEAGENFVIVKDEKDAKRLAEHRALKIKEAAIAKAGKARLEQMLKKIQEGEAKSLKLIIKGDVQGSIEALADALVKLSNDEIKVEVIHAAVGGITENDIMLASASDAVIIGFNIRPEAKVLPIAAREGVEIKLSNIIYEAVDMITQMLTGMLSPTFEEKVLGHAEVRQIFNIAKVGTIAGCFVNDGKITRDASVRLLRDQKIVHTGTLSSLKRFKDDAKEVQQGQDCGLLMSNYNDLKPGDVIEAFIMEKKAGELKPASEPSSKK